MDKVKERYRNHQRVYRMFRREGRESDVELAKDYHRKNPGPCPYCNDLA